MRKIQNALPFTCKVGCSYAALSKRIQSLPTKAGQFPNASSGLEMVTIKRMEAATSQLTTKVNRKWTTQSIHWKNANHSVITILNAVPSHLQLTRTNTVPLTKELVSLVIQATSATLRTLNHTLPNTVFAEENQTIGMIEALKPSTKMSRITMTAKKPVMKTNHVKPSTCNTENTSAKHMQRIQHQLIMASQSPNASSRMTVKRERNLEDANFQETAGVNRKWTTKLTHSNHAKIPVIKTLLAVPTHLLLTRTNTAPLTKKGKHRETGSDNPPTSALSRTESGLLILDKVNITL